MNDPSQMMNRSYPIWPPQPPLPEDPMAAFQNLRPVFAPGANPGRPHWKGKKAADKRNGGGGGGTSGYKPPTLNELQSQNRAKARRFYPKKKYARFAPYAPRNTTSFIIRAKKAGGIASLVSPCPVTPAILPTPTFSPSREGLVDMAKEEWGVDGYGTMKGLIRLRSHAPEDADEEADDGGGGSSESDVEEHLEVERRLDHDLSRFEMVYPSHGDEATTYLLERRVDDQDIHIAQLEEENLTLKERLFLMEQEMGEMRQRLQRLEAEYHQAAAPEARGSGDGDDNNEEVTDAVDNNNNNNSVNNNEEAGDEDGSENECGGADAGSEKSVGDCEEGDRRGNDGDAPMRE